MSAPARRKPLDTHILLFERSGTGTVTDLLLRKTRDGTPQMDYVSNEFWQELDGIAGYGVIVVDNIIYILGGFNTYTKSNKSKVFSYDIARGTWTSLAPLIRPRSYFAVSYWNECLYVTGGKVDANKITATVEIYDIKNDSWRKGGLLPEGRYGHCSMTSQAHGGIYISGGATHAGAYTSMWTFEQHKWQDLGDECPQELYRALQNHIMTEVNGKWYIIAGEESIERQTRLNDAIESFTPEIQAQAVDDITDLVNPWTCHLPRMVRARQGAAHVVLGQNIYVFGGSDAHDNSVLEVECFDTISQEWSKFLKLPTGNYTNVEAVIVQYPPRIQFVQEGFGQGVSGHTTHSTDNLMRWILW